MYYRNSAVKCKKKRSKKKIIIGIILIINVIFCSIIYYFDKVVEPTVMIVADCEMRAKSLDIINKNILNIYSKEFDYDDAIHIEKDGDGNITMLKADTVKLNALATEVALRSQNEIREIGAVGIKMPLGYVSKNNIISYWGPNIPIKMEPIGRVETSYDSTFESAGINQTRHKIYMNVSTKIRVILPLNNREVEVKNEIPVSETVIVGKIPRNALGLDLDNIKETNTKETKERE